MKTCGRCLVSLEDSCFFKRRLPSGNYTLQVWCKPCFKVNNRSWRKEKRATDREWSAKEDAKSSQYRKDNPAYHQRTLSNNRERSKTHYQANKEKYLEAWVRRDHAVGLSTPIWLSMEQKNEILDFYRQSKLLSDVTGQLHHVDHIVPIRGKNVCGLHVPWNLQTMPATENLSKGNSYDDWN